MRSWPKVRYRSWMVLGMPSHTCHFLGVWPISYCLTNCTFKSQVEPRKQHWESGIPQHSLVVEPGLLQQPDSWLEARNPLLRLRDLSACSDLRRNPRPPVRLRHSWGCRPYQRQAAGRGGPLHLAKNTEAALSHSVHHPTHPVTQAVASATGKTAESKWEALQAVEI